MILAELRCGASYRGKACARPVATIEPDVEATGMGLDRLVLHCFVPTGGLHEQILFDNDQGFVTAADLKQPGYRTLDYENEVFRLFDARPDSHLQPMPAEILAVCERGRHRDLLVERTEIVRLVAEIMVTRSKITRIVYPRDVASAFNQTGPAVTAVLRWALGNPKGFRQCRTVRLRALLGIAQQSSSTTSSPARPCLWRARCADRPCGLAAAAVVTPAGRHGRPGW